ncbi:hypothetical protein [Algiphilus sp.]|uniref:hypothetical protein n=1 Tax=Algiphilus sp. TaxID=1872431 RepID=UPI001CA63E29|nr:hypothetical protein [Algiphilus sp.]
MLRFTVVSAVVALTLSAIGLAALAPVNIWVAALTAAPVMVMVMALALLPIFAMALESAYIGSQRHEAAEVEDLDSRAPISYRDRFTPGA